MAGDIRPCADAICGTRVEEAGRGHGADCAYDGISMLDVLDILEQEANCDSLASPLRPYGQQ